MHLSKQFYIRSLLFIAGAVLSFVCLYYGGLLLRIKTVVVSGGTSEEKKSIQTYYKNKNLLFLHDADVYSHIQTRYPGLTVRQIERHYPDAILITLDAEKPFAYLQTDSGYVSVSMKGIVLKKERTSTIPSPSIQFYQPVRHNEYQVGQRVTYSQLQKTFIFIQLLIDEGFQVETVAIDSVDMIACKTRGFTVAFSQKRPTELQKYELQQLVKQLKIGALRVKRLDLRFDKPVVELQSP